MFRLETLFGRRRSLDDDKGFLRDDDKAIVHQTVPEGVLEPIGDDAPAPDMSWLDEVPSIEPTEPNEPAPEPNAPAPETGQPAHSTVPRPINSDMNGGTTLRSDLKLFAVQAANPAAKARPRFPCAWLVVVEGAGVGEWFVLERGVTHIGSAEGQTVRLDFGDVSVAPDCHLALAYDEGSHAFVLKNTSGKAVRINGEEAPSQASLRDGDVVSLGGTSLRLATLCSPNFNWSGAEDLKQE